MQKQLLEGRREGITSVGWLVSCWLKISSNFAQTHTHRVAYKHSIPYMEVIGFV